VSNEDDWNPRDYVGVSSQQMQWALETLQNAAFAGSENVLDVGCGDGKITASISEETTGKVLGIDRSSSMIAYAKQQHEGPSRRNLRFEIGEAETYRPTLAIDLITSFTALHWVSDHQKLLRHFSGILKKHGKLALQFPGHGNAASLIETAFEIMGSDRWRPFFTNFRFPWSFFSVEQYNHLLKQAGFIPRDVKLIGKTMSHEGAIGLRAWMKSTWLPFTERVPSGEVDGFLSAITDLYCRRFPADESDTVHTQMYRLQVIAEKSER
jgi:trans-aconitate 2-methyltransferase